MAPNECNIGNCIITFGLSLQKNVTIHSCQRDFNLLILLILLLVSFVSFTWWENIWQKPRGYWIVVKFYKIRQKLSVMQFFFGFVKQFAGKCLPCSLFSKGLPDKWCCVNLLKFKRTLFLQRSSVDRDLIKITGYNISVKITYRFIFKWSKVGIFTKVQYQQWK